MRPSSITGEELVQLTGAAPRNRECKWRLAMIAEEADPDALG
jgi:hypothetical protein